MSLVGLNTTEKIEVVDVLFRSIASSDAPLVLLESFMTGILCVCVPLTTYLLWVKPPSLPRVPILSVLWIVLIVLVTHWALSLRQLELTFVGRPLGSDIPPTSRTRNFYALWGPAWQKFLPTVTETVLCGFATFLFATTMYTSFRPMRSRWRSCFPMIIPAMSSLMYILSLAHWIISLWLLNQLTNEATHVRAPNYVTSLSSTRPVMYGSQVALSMLVAVNVALSDAVVLWRMCLVWERARPVVALGAGLIAATLGVNITSSVVIARRLLDPTPVTENNSDWALLFSYGTKYVGLAGAFMSLASNLCATVLVGVKAWLHRIQVCKYLRSDIVGKGRVSLVQSVMELLVESGVVYTAIWLLYCISFFRKITKHDIFGPDYADIAEVSAADHLATAIAQMTSIYPLMVFALVALDKIHHSQGPWTLRQDERLGERDQAVTVTIEIDVERSMAENTGPMRPMVASWGDDNNEYASGEMKPEQRTL